MKPETPWQADKPPRFTRLDAHDSYDAVVIGGGITGLSAAFLLKQSGLHVCLLERDRLGFVDSGLTTAHLTYVTDLRPAELLRTFGQDAAELVMHAGRVAIDKIEAIGEEENIDCDFQRVPGFLCAPFGEAGSSDKNLQHDAEAANQLGFPATLLAQIKAVRRPGILFPDQAKFHPLKYLTGLAKAVDGGGSRIHDQSQVTEVREDRVIANGKELRTRFVIVATHVPILGKASVVSATLLQTKIFPYTSYAIGAKIPRQMIAESCYWDTSDPYYYLRVEAGKRSDYVIFGGEDHKTGQEDNTNKCFARLQQALLKLIPEAKPDRQWSGQVIETNDGLPYIGEMGGQFVATGFSGNGMTFGTLAAMMACDFVHQRTNPWQKLFAVDRTKLRGGTWDYLTENVDFPYYYLRDRLAGVEGNSTRELKQGEGKILELNGEKSACSRDADGKVHTVSAYCTHMGCLVRWNNAEHTWDCPCHGSRFHPDGKVMAGPAETALEPVDPHPAPSQKIPAKSSP